MPHRQHKDFSQYLALADRLIETARSETVRRFRGEAAIFNKAGMWFDPVTDADREAERRMRAMITKVYPDHIVLGEEFGTSGGDGGEDGPWRWVIDPVDGTRAFVCGVPTWTTLIALEHRERPVMGVIDQPWLDETWTAVAGGETVYRLRGEETVCTTSGLADLTKARISTTDPRDTAYFTQKDAGAFARLAAATRIARFSMDAYAYALLALGELDIVAETGLHHHDFAALLPVVEGAGGIITNWSGEPVGNDEHGEVLACASAPLHEAALEILNSN